jgi:hypothetical protein
LTIRRAGKIDLLGQIDGALHDRPGRRYGSHSMKSMGLSSSMRRFNSEGQAGGVIEGFLWSLTGTCNPPSRMLLVSAVVVVAMFVASMMYFQKMESKIADVV